MFSRTLIFLLLLSLAYSFVDEYTKLYGDNLEMVIDDFDSEESENEKDGEDIEKDKLITQKYILDTPKYGLLLRPFSCLYFFPPIQVVQFKISTPPPESLLK